MLTNENKGNKIRKNMWEYQEMFLTKDEIIVMTGSRHRPKQIQWLNQRGYKYDVSLIGNPIVLKAHIDVRLGAVEQKNKRSQEPDFSRLE